MLVDVNLMRISRDILEKMYLDKFDHDLRSRRHFQMMGIGLVESSIIWGEVISWAL